MDDISIGDLIAAFADDEPKPDLSVADKWFTEFQQWLANDYEQIVHPPRDPGLHASGLGKVCGRRNLLIAAFGMRDIPHTAGNYFTFDVGHSLHQWWQERYLGPKQELWGDWMCAGCPCPKCENALEKIVRELNLSEKRAIFQKCESCRGTGRKVTRGLMPMNCECGVPWQDAVHYLELQVVNSDLNYVGHCDGVLDHSPKRRLFEFKTISPSEYEKLSGGPKEEHIIQAHAYMQPLELDEALIVYQNKGSQCKWSVNMFGQFEAGTPKVVPFLIRFDEEIWNGIVARVKDHERAIEILNELKPAGRRPSREMISSLPRACADKKCDLAARCPVSRECFSLD